MQGSYFYLNIPSKNLLKSMNLNYYRWKRVLLFGLGLSLGTTFCMKWMEGDLWANNEKFTILGLELFYSAKKVETILSSLDSRVQTILRYHLYFDFAFMAGVYPCILALCMMARQKLHATPARRLLFMLAIAQLLAWAADIIENYCLLGWIKQPVITSGFNGYHFIVAVKWVIALAGVLVALPLVLRKKNADSF
jgi:hypothetical protein